MNQAAINHQRTESVANALGVGLLDDPGLNCVQVRGFRGFCGGRGHDGRQARRV